MKRLLFAITAGTLLLTVSETGAQSDLLEIYNERRQLMYDMQSALWPMFDINNEKSTDLDAVARSAGAMSAAMTKALTLFPVGTAKGDIPFTRAKPEIWSDAVGFETAAKALNEAAASMKAAADAGDIDAFKAQFGGLIEACTGCHDLKPSGGGRYRFPL